jgi:hypothetical protein
MPPRTVKGIPRPDQKSDLTDAFVQQICATIDSPTHASPHFRRVPVAISSYLGAEVGNRGPITGERAQVGAQPVEW